MRKSFSIISWYGIKDVGGVERVMRGLNEILSKQNIVNIIDQEYCLSKYPYLAPLAKYRIGQMVLASLAAGKQKRRGDILIGNGFNAPFVHKDINFAHGTMYLLKKRLRQFPWGGSSLFEVLSMRKSDLILAISEETKETLVRYYRINRRKIKVLNNCVDDKIFYPLNKPETKDVTILFSGRLEECKGYKTILKLAKYIENKNGIKLKIATPTKENVELFQNLKNTTVKTGIQYNDMNSFYNSGDVMFFPSRSEGFGLVTIECLSSGIPVVCYGVGAGGEIIAQNGQGVYLAERIMCKLLGQLISVASEYRDISKRMELHNQISDSYGVERYEEKVNEMICFIITKKIQNRERHS